MSEKSPRIITRKQAVRQIDHFGRSLVLYIFLFMVLQYGSGVLYRFNPELFSGYSPETVMIGGSLVLTLFITLVPFRLSAKALQLDIRDYLKTGNVTAGKLLSLTCIGMAVYLAAIALGSLLSLFSRTGSLSYSFLGKFNSRDYMTANILYFLLFVLIKPVCDEYIFRGIIQRQLGHYGRHFGIVASALLYAFAQPSLTQAVPCLALGWFLSQVTIRFHSIRPGIVIHCMIMLFLWALEVSPPGMLVLFILLIVLVYLVAGLNVFQKQHYEKIVRLSGSEQRLWEILFSAPTIIICSILFLANVFLSFL